MMHIQQHSRILVIGGGGYVGVQLCKLLESKGIGFAVLDNFSAQPKDSISDTGWQIFEADITHAVQVDDVFETYKPTHVIHLAAKHFIPYCIENPGDTIETNVLGLQHVIAAINRMDGPAHMLFVSSAAVYQDSPRALSEDMPLAPIDIYGATKLLGEHYVRRDLASYSIVRLFNVYGRSDPHPHAIPRFYGALARNGTEVRVGDTAPERDFVHVDDVARALYSVLSMGMNRETYNVGTGQSHSIAQVITLLAGQIGCTPKVIANAKAFTRQNDRMLLLADTQKITHDTGWRPLLPFREGLLTLEHSNG